MSDALLADAVLVLHLGFIVWAVAGGLALLWRPWLAAVHLPAAAWAAWISFSGGICPLTPLEQRLRRDAGQQGYEGGFIEHYVGALIYPAGLTPAHQWAIGAFVVVLNAVFYGLVVYRVRLGRKETLPP